MNPPTDGDGRSTTPVREGIASAPRESATWREGLSVICRFRILVRRPLKMLCFANHFFQFTMSEACHADAANQPTTTAIVVVGIETQQRTSFVSMGTPIGFGINGDNVEK